MNEREEHNLRTGSRFRRIARRQLAEFPLCAQCARELRITAAEVVHHVDRVNHDRTKLYVGPFESLCRHCHDGIVAMLERGRGYDPTIGADGWPISPSHPVYQR